MAEMRTFETGATRDQDDTKIDYEGFLSPYALETYGKYMLKHRQQADGSLRASDNWQKGIPLPVYMKSLLRHVFELWRAHRDTSLGLKDLGSVEKRKELCCAILFNAFGYLHELEKQ